MSAGAGPPPPDPYADAPVEDERMREQRAAYEAELARITVPDMLMQATVSLLNLAARRLVPETGGTDAGAGAGGPGEAQATGRDLEQARDAIDAVRALLEILERRMPGELKPLRDALSQLQLAYAAEMGKAGAQPAADAPGGGSDPDSGGSGPAGGGSEPSAGGSEPSGGGAAPSGGGQEPPEGGGQQQKGPGPAESSGRLWVPGR